MQAVKTPDLLTLVGALLEVRLVNLTFIPIAAERRSATPC